MGTNMQKHCNDPLTTTLTPQLKFKGVSASFNSLTTNNMRCDLLKSLQKLHYMMNLTFSFNL